MNNVKEAEQNENVFIGARVLGEEGVKLVLPTYDVLISQIEQMKSVARNSEKQNSNISRIMKYNREHNNTIAIFGKRGTGKTSAVYTLMNYLLNQNDSNKKEKNIVLPIIEPDNFGDNTKIMGSIVGLIKNEVDEILTEIKSTGNKLEQYFRNCIYVENNPLKQKMDELLEHHMYSDSEYRNIITHNYTDTATHIKKSSHLLIPDINLKHKFWDVIDEIVKIYKNELNKDEDATIFIFIDDIDLKTTKCKELIEAIMQFSSHPNVITILSGDYEILEEGVMLSLIGDENLREKGLDSNFILKNKIESKNELLNLDKTKIHIENANVNTININESIETGFTIKDRKLDLAKNYLKKIIPPSRRHYVVDWNIENIPEFSFGETKLKDILYKFYNNEDNIFAYKDMNSSICSTKYPYVIFDTTPRGLINVYYNISKIVKNDKRSFFDIKLFIDTIIESSPELLKNKEKFYKFINWGIDFKSTQINYDKLIIKGNENSSLKESLSYFIIAEILLYNENSISHEGIYYDKDKYYEAKENILTSLYYNASIENLYKDNIEYKTFKKRNRVYYKNLYNIVIIFALNLEFVDSLIFLNMLVDSEFKYKYAYEDYFNEYQINEEKNRHCLKSIYEIIKLDELNKKEILKKMLVYSNENKEFADNINCFFSFLYDESKITKEFDIMKRKNCEIYKRIHLINKKSIFLNMKKISIENPLLGNKLEQKYKFYKEVYEMGALYNRIIFNSIRAFSLNETNYSSNEKIYKVFINKNSTKINDKISKNTSKVKKSTIEEFLRLIEDKNSNYFKIRPELISINNIDYVSESIKNFYNTATKNIRYIATKNNINNILFENIEIDIEEIYKQNRLKTSIENKVDIEEVLKSEKRLNDLFISVYNVEGLLKPGKKIKDLFKNDIKIKDLFLKKVKFGELLEGKFSFEKYQERANTFQNLLAEDSILAKCELKDLLKYHIKLEDILKDKNELINIVKDVDNFENSINRDNDLNHIFEFNKLSNNEILKKKVNYKIKLIELIKLIKGDSIIEIYFIIKEFAENIEICYGIQEARKILEVLNESICIDFQQLDEKKYFPMLYYIENFNEHINQELREDIEFEDIKGKMKKLLDDVYSESMEEVMKEDEEFGFGIERKFIESESEINI